MQLQEAPEAETSKTIKVHWKMTLHLIARDKVLLPFLSYYTNTKHFGALFSFDHAYGTEPHLELGVTAFYLIMSLGFLSLLHYCISSVHVSIYNVAFLAPNFHNFLFSIHCFQASLQSMYKHHKIKILIMLNNNTRQFC